MFTIVTYSKSAYNEQYSLDESFLKEFRDYNLHPSEYQPDAEEVIRQARNNERQDVSTVNPLYYICLLTECVKQGVKAQLRYVYNRYEAPLMYQISEYGHLDKKSNVPYHFYSVEAEIQDNYLAAIQKRYNSMSLQITKR